jgi:hypothetical protein
MVRERRPDTGRHPVAGRNLGETVGGSCLDALDVARSRLETLHA